MQANDRPEPYRSATAERWIPARFAGVQARPFWAGLASWAVLCGALASHGFHWDGASLLTLALALLLAELAWGTLWDLASGVDWFRPLAEGWPPKRPASWRGLPYTQPGSPGGRMLRGVNRLAGWWRDDFWPAAGPALLGALAATVLAVVLAQILPARLRPLYGALVALLGLGLVRRRRGKDLAASQVLVQVGLSWLAGHLAFSAMSLPSLGLALAFSAAALGMLKVEAGQGRGLGLAIGGQAAAAVWLAGFGQPLPAAAMGLLVFCQAILQLPLQAGAQPARVIRRAMPWMFAAMILAALAIP